MEAANENVPDKMMNSVLKMMNSVFKMIDSELKMMNFEERTTLVVTGVF